MLSNLVSMLTKSLSSKNLSLLISICIGGITYFVIIYFMKIKDVDVIVELIKKKFIKVLLKGK